jgi:hypothetical protein
MTLGADVLCRAIGRGIAETFGLILFLVPVIVAAAVMLHVAAHDTDLLVRPADAWLLHFGRTAFSVVDYIFGAPFSVNGFWTAHASWLLTPVHVLILLIVTLIVANLLIAIVGDSWEESVLDGEAWRRFGRAAFATAVVTTATDGFHLPENGGAAARRGGRVGRRILEGQPTKAPMMPPDDRYDQPRNACECRVPTDAKRLPLNRR